jgi:dTDP-4-amino-4,6-dideoxygalactose transaminase
LDRVVPPVKTYFADEDIVKIKEDAEKILRSGMLTLHEYTREFEGRFADLCGVKHAVAVNSGTSALEIALRSSKLADGDEVLVPTNTFTSTAAAVFFAGGKPVFTDVDPNTLCINAENVEKHLASKTRGVIVVHVGGLICPEIKEIRENCEDKGLFLIEDAAHAHGSTINGQHAGSLGDVGCFSFYPTKVITTGEGGMITTDNDKVAEIAGILRDQGKESFYSNKFVRLGYNWRLPEISAAIGLTQLHRLSEIIEKRKRLAKFYNKELEKIEGIKPLNIPENIESCYYKYVCFLDSRFDRDSFKQKLREKGVKCGGEVYWPPLHLQPIYQEMLGTKEGDFPFAENACRRMLCLPMYTQMKIEEATYVVEKIKETFDEF